MRPLIACFFFVFPVGDGVRPANPDGTAVQPPSQGTISVNAAKTHASATKFFLLASRSLIPQNLRLISPTCCSWSSFLEDPPVRDGRWNLLQRCWPNLSEAYATRDFLFARTSDGRVMSNWKPLANVALHENGAVGVFWNARIVVHFCIDKVRAVAAAQFPPDSAGNVTRCPQLAVGCIGSFASWNGKGFLAIDITVSNKKTHHVEERFREADILAIQEAHRTVERWGCATKTFRHRGGIDVLINKENSRSFTWIVRHWWMNNSLCLHLQRHLVTCSLVFPKFWHVRE